MVTETKIFHERKLKFIEILHFLKGVGFCAYFIAKGRGLETLLIVKSPFLECYS